MIAGLRHAPIRERHVEFRVSRASPDPLQANRDQRLLVYTLDRFQVETPDELDDQLFEVSALPCAVCFNEIGGAHARELQAT